MANKSNSKKKKKKSVYSGIGGQAVLEGIMMKNKDIYSVAVRLPDGSIDVKKWDAEGIGDRSILGKIPFIRGVVNFVDSLVLGMKTLTYSSSFYEEEETETKFDIFLRKLFGDKAESVVSGFTVFLSILLAIGLFMLAPMLLSEWLGKRIQNDSLIAIIEGAFRILVFLIYILSISLMKDVRRLYQYHGAEHKCINCVESGRPLTVRNVMRSSRIHRRCGTSFLVFVVMLSVVFFFFIRVDQIWLKMLLRIALVPVIASISYEILRLAGKSDNIIILLLSLPGLLLQRITTKEPDEEMVEVAIAAVEKVFDWEKFQNKHFKRKAVKKTIKEDDGSIVETGEETLEISVIEVEQRIQQMMEEAELIESDDSQSYSEDSES